MRCPYCRGVDNLVLDSRPRKDFTEQKRRRRCNVCGKRFTTTEHITEGYNLDIQIEAIRELDLIRRFIEKRLERKVPREKREG